MFSPGMVFIISYLIAILIGSSLLMMPWATKEGHMAWIDALFTATSALCVTGLTVVDTGSTFSFYGQVVILTLIELGGLGIMTFAALLYLTTGWGISMRQRSFIQETFSSDFLRDIKKLVVFIFSFTFIIELAGAFLLMPCWNKGFTLGQNIFYSLFHSISAFCNAGFSLFPDSFMGYRNNILLNMTVTSLVILGGVGFPVIRELISAVRTKERIRLSLHTKLTLVVTIVLILFGTFIFWSLEANRYMSGLPWWEKILVSYFQSVTTRTAGFNTVDFSLLGNATLMFTILLMFIGASPGSAGGGIKTTSAGALFVVLWNRLRGSETNNVFKATLPEEIVSRTITVFIVSIFFIIFVLSLLMVEQQGTVLIAQSRGLFLEYFFEAVSAFGTVGLSMGITPKMDSLGKFFIIITMLVGRLGILTLVYVIINRREAPRYCYAEENVLIG